MNKALKPLAKNSYARPKRRLPSNYDRPVSANLSPNLNSALGETAKDLNLSKSWIIARAVAEFLGERPSTKELEALPKSKASKVSKPSAIRSIAGIFS